MNAQELRQIVASNIKKYRDLSNVTQLALAEMADISVGCVRKGWADDLKPVPITPNKLGAAVQTHCTAALLFCPKPVGFASPVALV